MYTQNKMEIQPVCTDTPIQCFHDIAIQNLCQIKIQHFRKIAIQHVCTDTQIQHKSRYNAFAPTIRLELTIHLFFFHFYGEGLFESEPRCLVSLSLRRRETRQTAYTCCRSITTSTQHTAWCAREQRATSHLQDGFP